MDLLQLWVRGDNHLLVRGPRLEAASIREYFRRLESPTLESLTKPGPILPPTHQIVTKAFREEIGLAVLLPDERKHSAAVAQLLSELRHRGVEIVEVEGA